MHRPCDTGFLHKPGSAAFIVIFLWVSLALAGAARAASPLDTSFGSGGKVFTDFSHYRDVVYDMAVQPDGKIVAVGVATLVSSGVQTTKFGLARYNSDGTLDNSFGADGRVSTDFPNIEDVAYGVALQPDGKIVVVGSTFNTDTADFAIARYNSNGTLDNTFGSGGKVIVDFATRRDEARAVVIQPDGKIVIGGSAVVNGGLGFALDFALVRLNGDGSFDNTFDGDGKLTTNIPGP
ncbi:MAG: hypothetical protein JO360_00460, partial [Acidobacteria bacterium]|nr:hypothetical protein [Acidobacteriota bacterium]